MKCASAARLRLLARYNILGMLKLSAMIIPKPARGCRLGGLRPIVHALCGVPGACLDSLAQQVRLKRLELLARPEFPLADLHGRGPAEFGHLGVAVPSPNGHLRDATKLAPHLRIGHEFIDTTVEH